MFGETARTDDTYNALGNPGTEEPRQEDCDLSQLLQETFYTVRFRCEYCETSYPELSDMRIHLQTHAEYKLYECTDCQASFSNVDHFLTHFNLHPEKDMKCNKCSKKFQRKKITFGKHLEAHNCVKFYQSDCCSYSTENRRHINDHLRIHKPRRFNCDTCVKTFLYKCDLEEHVRRRCEDFKCKSCGKKFDICRNLDMHITYSKSCQNRITHQSKQTELVRTTPSSVRCSSEPETYSGPANPFGGGNSSTSGQQFSYSPQQADSHNAREVSNFPNRIRTSETRSSPGNEELPDLHSTIMTILGSETERGSWPLDNPGSSTDISPSTKFYH